MAVYMQFWDLKSCNLSYKVLFTERNVCTQSICRPLIITNMFGSELLFNALLPTHTFLPLSSVCGNFILLITNDLMFLYFHTSKITAILICPESVKFFWFGGVTFQAGNTDCFPPPGAMPSWCLVVIQPRNGHSTSHCLWVSTLFFFLFLYLPIHVFPIVWHSSDPILLINKVYRLCQQTDWWYIVVVTTPLTWK